MADAEYPATPGDIYELSYTFRGEPVTLQVSVTPNYRVSLGIFGSIEAEDMTFQELRNAAEGLVNQFYPGSHPQLSLVTPAEFLVTVFLEGQGTEPLTAWGLSRLSDVIRQLDLDERYSVRRIRITDGSGRDDLFDYYDYLYRNDFTADPLIRPGSRIYFSYSTRLLEFSGEVMEPGIREAAPGDTVDDIVHYIGGFMPTADLERIQKHYFEGSRELHSVHSWGDMELFAASSEVIRIHVPSVIRARDFMYVEINQPPPVDDSDETQEATPDSIFGEYTRIALPVFDGMLVSDVLEQVESDLIPLADLEHSFLVRGGEDSESVSVNLEEVKNNPSSPFNVPVGKNDVLGIPARVVFVTVSGGVYEPGRYYYTPMRTADYYVTLAGGIDPEQNSHRNIVVYDQDGELKDRDSLIEPGDDIVVVQDNMVFQVNNKFAAIATGLTFVTSLTLLITAIAGGL